jgi:hypothetical protein
MFKEILIVVLLFLMVFSIVLLIIEESTKTEYITDVIIDKYVNKEPNTTKYGVLVIYRKFLITTSLLHKNDESTNRKIVEIQVNEESYKYAKVGSRLRDLIIIN